MLAFPQVMWNLYSIVRILMIKMVIQSWLKLKRRPCLSLSLYFLKVLFALLCQGFLRYLLQEAAVEPCESTDRKEHLEWYWGVLQTHGWGSMEFQIGMPHGKMVAGFHRLCVPTKRPAGVLFSCVNGDAGARCHVWCWAPGTVEGCRLCIDVTVFYPHREWTATKRSIDGDRRRSSGGRIEDAAIPAPSQTHLLAAPGRQGER